MFLPTRRRFGFVPTLARLAHQLDVVDDDQCRLALRVGLPGAGFEGGQVNGPVESILIGSLAM